MKQITSGATTSKFSNQGRSRLCGQTLTSQLSSVMEIVSPDGSVVRKPNDLNQMSPGRPFTYSCHGNTFIYKEAVGAGPGGTNMQFDYIFHRRP